MEFAEFESAIRHKADFAGVYEYDGDTAYFYLYGVGGAGPGTIIDYIHIFSGTSDLRPEDVCVRWDHTQDRVGLFIRGLQWAVFNLATGRKYGGGYRVNALPIIPPDENFAA